MSELNGMTVNNQSSSTGMSMTGNRQVIGLTIQRAVSPTSWSEVMQKPFETVGQNLKVVNSGLSVDTATTVEAGGTKPVTGDAVNTKVTNAVSGKQDTIADLADIRSGASAGATAYQKPASGIPKTDMAQAVQTSLGKADTALQEHQSLAAYRTASAQDAIDATKVDKISGKGLSTNDYTNAEKTKLAGIETGADVTDATNVSAAGAVMRSAQASKTASQTEQIGVDANGMLWADPGGVDYLTVQNGKICVIYEEANA